jgi:hypothetical protein
MFMGNLFHRNVYHNSTKSFSFYRALYSLKKWMLMMCVAGELCPVPKRSCPAT